MKTILKVLLATLLFTTPSFANWKEDVKTANKILHKGKVVFELKEEKFFVVSHKGDVYVCYLLTSNRSVGCVLNEYSN